MSQKLLKEYLQLFIEGGATAERQEKGIIDAVNKIASIKNPITVMSSGSSIDGVIGANKMSNLSALGKEAYTDVQFILINGETVNISAKGPTAPSLAGGGLLALQLLIPDIMKRFLLSAKDALAKAYKNGAMGAPDIFGMIPYEEALSVLRGNEDMGGPIDYMYQGPMDVKVIQGGPPKSVTLNGAFTSIEVYAKSHKLYIRARKRRIDQPVDLTGEDANGLPLLFGKSPTKGDSGRRIVVSEKPPRNALIVNINI